MATFPNTTTASSASVDYSMVNGVAEDFEGLEILDPDMVGEILENDRVLGSIASEIMTLDFDNGGGEQNVRCCGQTPAPLLQDAGRRQYNDKDLSKLGLENYAIGNAEPTPPTRAVGIGSGGKDLSKLWEYNNSSNSNSLPGQLPLNVNGDISVTIPSAPSISDWRQPPICSPTLSSSPGALSSSSAGVSIGGGAPSTGSRSPSSSVYSADLSYASGGNSDNDGASVAAATISSNSGSGVRSRRSGDGQQQQLCEICSCQASEYKYYGARSCQSCRAFFRRAVQKAGGYQSLKCRAAKKGGTGEVGKCRIDSQSWRSCRYCRFQKCVEAGMNPKWVLNDAEKRRRAERLDAIKREREQRLLLRHRQERDLMSQVPAEPPDLVSRQEMKAISHLAMARMGVFAQELRRFFYANFANGRLQRIADSKAGNTPLHIEDLKTFDALFTHLHTKFIEESIDCSNILPGDKRVLLRNNCRMLVSLGHSIHVEIGGENSIMVGRAIDMAREAFQQNPEEFAKFGAIRAVAYGVPPSQQGASSSSSNSIQQQRQHPLLQRRGSLEDDEEDELMQMPFQRFLSKERREKSARFTYEQFYPPSWVGNAELERRHKENGAKVAAWFEGSPDHIQFFLLSMIIIFSASFLELQQPEAVERTQLTYARALHRYLRYKLYRSAKKQKKLELKRLEEEQEQWEAAQRRRSSSEHPLTPEEERTLQSESPFSSAAAAALIQGYCPTRIDLGAAAKKLGDGMMILSLAKETQRIKELGHGPPAAEEPEEQYRQMIMMEPLMTYHQDANGYMQYNGAYPQQQQHGYTYYNNGSTY